MTDERQRGSAGSTAAAWVGGVLLAVVMYALSFGPVVALTEKWGLMPGDIRPLQLAYAPLGLIYVNTTWGRQWLDDYVHWWNRVLGTKMTKL